MDRHNGLLIPSLMTPQITKTILRNPTCTVTKREKDYVVWAKLHDDLYWPGKIKPGAHILRKGDRHLLVYIFIKNRYLWVKYCNVMPYTKYKSLFERVNAMTKLLKFEGGNEVSHLAAMDAVKNYLATYGNVEVCSATPTYLSQSSSYKVTNTRCTHAILTEINQTLTTRNDSAGGDTPTLTIPDTIDDESKTSATACRLKLRECSVVLEDGTNNNHSNYSEPAPLPRRTIRVDPARNDFIEEVDTMESCSPDAICILCEKNLKLSGEKYTRLGRKGLARINEITVIHNELKPENPIPIHREEIRKRKYVHEWCRNYHARRYQQKGDMIASWSPNATCLLCETNIIFTGEKKAKFTCVGRKELATINEFTARHNELNPENPIPLHVFDETKKQYVHEICLINHTNARRYQQKLAGFNESLYISLRNTIGSRPNALRLERTTPKCRMPAKSPKVGRGWQNPKIRDCSVMLVDIFKIKRYSKTAKDKFLQSDIDSINQMTTAQLLLPDIDSIDQQNILDNMKTNFNQKELSMASIPNNFIQKIVTSKRKHPPRPTYVRPRDFECPATKSCTKYNEENLPEMVVRKMKIMYVGRCIFCLSIQHAGVNSLVESTWYQMNKVINGAIFLKGREGDGTVCPFDSLDRIIECIGQSTIWWHNLCYQRFSDILQLSMKWNTRPRNEKFPSAHPEIRFELSDVNVYNSDFNPDYVPPTSQEDSEDDIPLARLVNAKQEAGTIVDSSESGDTVCWNGLQGLAQDPASLGDVDEVNVIFLNEGDVSDEPDVVLKEEDDAGHEPDVILKEEDSVSPMSVGEESDASGDMAEESARIASENISFENSPVDSSFKGKLTTEDDGTDGANMSAHNDSSKSWYLIDRDCMEEVKGEEPFITEVLDGAPSEDPLYTDIIGETGMGCLPSYLTEQPHFLQTEMSVNGLSEIQEREESNVKETFSVDGLCFVKEEPILGETLVQEAEEQEEARELVESSDSSDMPGDKIKDLLALMSSRFSDD